MIGTGILIMKWVRPIQTFLKIGVTLWLLDLFIQRPKMAASVKSTHLAEAGALLKRKGTLLQGLSSK